MREWEPQEDESRRTRAYDFVNQEEMKKKSAEGKKKAQHLMTLFVLLHGKNIRTCIKRDLAKRARNDDFHARFAVRKAGETMSMSR